MNGLVVVKGELVKHHLVFSCKVEDSQLGLVAYDDEAAVLVEGDGFERVVLACLVKSE